MSAEGVQMGLRELAYKLYERRLEASLSAHSIPRHVGVILDGNRRWARMAGLSDVSHGHQKGADRLDMPALGHQFPHGALDDPEQRHHLIAGPGQVVGGQQPQGDHLDPGLAAPAEQFEDVVGALLVSVADVGQAGHAGPPPVAVEDHPDVPGDRVRGQRRFQPALVELVGELAQSHLHPFCAHARRPIPDDGEAGESATNLR